MEISLEKSNKDRISIELIFDFKFLIYYYCIHMSIFFYMLIHRRYVHIILIQQADVFAWPLYIHMYKVVQVAHRFTSICKYVTSNVCIPLNT